MKLTYHILFIHILLAWLCHFSGFIRFCCISLLFYSFSFLFLADSTNVRLAGNGILQLFVIETLCFLTFLYFFGRALSIECVVVSMICLIPAWLSTPNYDMFVFYWFANKYMYCFSLKSLLLLNAILIFGEIILSLIFDKQAEEWSGIYVFTWCLRGLIRCPWTQSFVAKRLKRLIWNRTPFC